MAEEAHAAFVHEVFGAWLNSPRLHGCRFASSIAKGGGRIWLGSFFGSPTGVAVQKLSEHVQLAASAQQLAVAVFPDIVTAGQVRQFIELLAVSPGWTVAPVDIAGRFAVDIRWRSSAALESSVTGFAPLGTMPVTRRAPYVAVALWPCGHDNPRRKKPHSFVGLGDMAHEFTDETYDKLHRATKERVSRAKEVHNDPSLFTGMTFCLEDQPNV
jgi:hypothetical protein